MTDEVVRMQPGVAARLRAKLDRHAAAFDAMASDVHTVMEALDAGAGEFSSAMSAGSGAFGASWSEAVVRCERSAQAIGEHVTSFGTALDLLDLGSDGGR